MKDFFQKILTRFITSPKPEFLAKQLNKPQGFFGKKVGLKMNRSNAFLYDFVLPNLALKNGQHVLEIGFGNGNFFSKLFAIEPDCRVYGIDFSELMLNEAKRNNKNHVQSGKLNLHFGDSETLPFDNDFFDTVFCINVIYFWKEPEKYLAEIQRVLKPGGTFVAGFRSKESMRHLPFVQFGFVQYSNGGWETVMRQNGFSSIQTHSTQEPEVELYGKKFPVEALCVSGVK